MAIRKKRLGELLVEAGVITLPQLNLALERMKFTKARLGEQLVNLKICTEKDIVDALSKQLRIPVVDLKSIKPDPEVFTIVPKSLALDANCFPFKIDGRFIHIAFADPLRLDKIQNLEAKTQRAIKKYLATQSEIDEAIEEYYTEDDAAKDIMNSLEDEGDIATDVFMDMGLPEEGEEGEFEDVSAVELKRASEDKGVVKAVNQIIRRAVLGGASDIHFEPQRKILLVRQRIDGILHELARLPRSIAPALVSRIKILAGLDIAERRLPQDGKVRATLDGGRDVDLRVSTLPTKYGEKVVIRILDQSKSALSLEAIFFEPEQLEKVKSIIKASQGMILVTGPTGSGKTTTLYSIITALKSPETNIVTIEDPIEYELEGVNQVQVNHQIGLSFAKILRSILRQDPEVILVGEIRDMETAQVAFQASQTGHLVLSTLHTNSTYATVTRLMDIGIDPMIVASSLQGILAQRLVRRICSECKEEYEPDPIQLMHYNIPPGTKLYRGKGCEKCHYTGYKGRMSVVEIMTMSPELRAVIGEGKPEHVIKETAVRNGMELLFDRGRRYVLKGYTTLDELRRVLETAEESNGLDEAMKAGLPAAKGREPAVALQAPAAAPAAAEPAPAAEGKCASCGETLKPGWKVCPYCGAEVPKPKPPRCPSCNEEVQPRWKVCPNCGTSLEAAPAAPARAPSAPAPVSTERSIEGRPKVLVVDDQKSMQKLVSIALKGIGCEVETADDGIQALEAVKRFKPHLIILDIVMPRMDGLEVCRRLRADVSTAFIPIMMLTSLSDEKSRLKGYVAGTDDYLAKPFVLEEFYTRVRNLLRRTYGYSFDDDLLGVGDEWDSATEEARARQKMMDKQSHKQRLESGGGGSSSESSSPDASP